MQYNRIYQLRVIAFISSNQFGVQHKYLALHMPQIYTVDVDTTLRRPFHTDFTVASLRR